MHRNLSRLFPVLLAVILVLLTFWLEYLLTNLPSSQNSVNKDTVEYLATDYHSTAFDARGQIDKSAFGKELWQFPQQKRIHFSDSTLEQYQEGKRTLSVSAKTGHYDSDSKIAFLDQDVHLRREPTPTRPNVATVDTSKLTVNTEKRSADTNAPTVYQEGAVRVTATGVHYNDVTQQLTLKSRVRMTHVPQ